MPKFQDLKGEKFERMLVLRRGENSKAGRTRWLCRCDCGAEKLIQSNDLKTGKVKSCGCYNSDRITKHGLNEHKLYPIWQSMLARCTNPNDRAYKNYGGRGITVCDEWLDEVNGIKNFIFWAESSGYERGLEIDREDNDGNYEPSNCRFVDCHTNNCNRRLSTKNTSGYAGVCFNKRDNVWRADITIRGKRIIIGQFGNKKDALDSRNNYILENDLTEYKIQKWIG